MSENVFLAAKRVILCVVPNEDYIPALRLALSKYELVMVANALDAIRAYNARSFDAYVLDYWLPDWNGAGLCRQIRETEAHAPICFYSSAESAQQRSRALRAGATLFVHAAGGAEVLAAKLRALLQAADVQSLQARVEEERAIQFELERRSRIAMERTAHAQARALEAIQRAARVRAQKAFVSAGGSLATFDRWWPGQWQSAEANYRVAAEGKGADAPR